MKHLSAIGFAAIAMMAPANAADIASQLNAQELARISGGAPAPMAPPPTAVPPIAGPAVASACPPGWYWAEAGYTRKGKARPGGCVRRR